MAGICLSAEGALSAAVPLRGREAVISSWQRAPVGHFRGIHRLPKLISKSEGIIGSKTVHIRDRQRHVGCKCVGFPCICARVMRCKSCRPAPLVSVVRHQKFPRIIPRRKTELGPKPRTANGCNGKSWGIGRNGLITQAQRLRQPSQRIAPAGHWFPDPTAIVEKGLRPVDWPRDNVPRCLAVDAVYFSQRRPVSPAVSL